MSEVVLRQSQIKTLCTIIGEDVAWRCAPHVQDGIGLGEVGIGDGTSTIDNADNGLDVCLKASLNDTIVDCVRCDIPPTAVGCYEGLNGHFDMTPGELGGDVIGRIDDFTGVVSLSEVTAG